MLDIMLKYTFKTLFRRKKATVGAVVMISLCLALVLTVVNGVISVEESYDKYFSEKYGEYTGLFEITSSEAFEYTQGAEEVSCTVSRFGTLNSEKSLYDSRLTLGYVSSLTEGGLPIRLKSGRMPINKNEIAVEESLGEKLLLDISEGSTADLKVTLLSGESVTESFEVVGVISDYVSFSGMEREGVRVLPSVLVSEGFAADYNEREMFAVVSGMDTISLRTLADGFGGECYFNPLYDEGSVVYSVEESSYVLFSIMAVCAMLISVVSIYVYVRLSRGEIAEHCRTLKLIGGGYKELIAYTLFRTLAIYCISVVCGTVLGAVGCHLFGILVLGKFISIYYVHFSIASILPGIGLTFFAVLIPTVAGLVSDLKKRPVEAGNYAMPVQSRRLSVKNILKKWFLASVLNNKRAYLGIVLAMCFCFFAVFVGAMFNYTIRDEYEKEYYNDYSVESYDGSFVTSFGIPTAPYHGVTESLVEELRANRNVKYVSTVKELPAIVVDDDLSPKLKSFFGSSARDYSIMSDDYKFITDTFDLNYDSEYYKTRLAEVDDSLLERFLNSENVKGTPDVEKLKLGEEVIVVCFDKDYCPYAPGDLIKLFQALPAESGRFSPSDCDILKIEVKVGAVVGINDRNTYLGSKIYASPGMKCVFGSGAFEKMGMSLNNTKVYVDLKDKAAHADVDEVLGRVKEALPNSRIVSRIDSEAEKEALLNSIDISVSGLSLFIWCICFFVYYNIVDSKFRAQKRLWGVLRAMGVKRGNVIAAHIVETLTVSLAAVLLNLIILLIVMLSPVRNDIPIVTFRLLGAYLASALFFAIGTLPAVLSQFNPRIIEQIEYID